MSTDAHSEHPEHGADAHGDHGHGHDDDHGHGHGHEVAWEIIPENSGADRFLIFLCALCLIGLLYFSGAMATAPHHEGGEKGAEQQQEAPAQPSNEEHH